MKPLYHPETEAIDLFAVLYALSDPIRLHIVRALAVTDEKPCGTFDIPIAKSTASHHFKVLREAGVIKVRTAGTQRYTSLRGQDLETRFPRLLDVVLGAAEGQELV